MSRIHIVRFFAPDKAKQLEALRLVLISKPQEGETGQAENQALSPSSSPIQKRKADSR